mmetsp:Transcript_23503/g.59428  ORF Transcript_23503/g.59428 Transcript_23503/m.59428 type:complete len:220 (-) Transcript_23503:1225-1884(-)
MRCPRLGARLCLVGQRHRQRHVRRGGGAPRGLGRRLHRVQRRRVRGDMARKRLRDCLLCRGPPPAAPPAHLRPVRVAHCQPPWVARCHQRGLPRRGPRGARRERRHGSHRVDGPQDPGGRGPGEKARQGARPPGRGGGGRARAGAQAQGPGAGGRAGEGAGGAWHHGDARRIPAAEEGRALGLPPPLRGRGARPRRRADRGGAEEGRRRRARLHPPRAL